MDVGLGTPQSCLARAFLLLHPPLYRLLDLPGPHILSVPVPIFQLPIPGSETNKLSVENADVTSPTNEVRANTVSNKNAFNVFYLSISPRCSFGGRSRLLPRAIPSPQRMECIELEGRNTAISYLILLKSSGKGALCESVFELPSLLHFLFVCYSPIAQRIHYSGAAVKGSASSKSTSHGNWANSSPTLQRR